MAPNASPIPTTQLVTKLLLNALPHELGRYVVESGQGISLAGELSCRGPDPACMRAPLGLGPAAAPPPTASKQSAPATAAQHLAVSGLCCLTGPPNRMAAAASACRLVERDLTLHTGVDPCKHRHAGAQCAAATHRVPHQMRECSCPAGSAGAAGRAKGAQHAGPDAASR